MVEQFIVVDNYTSFLRCLSAISDYVTDVDIQNGIIRQVDSSRTWMMEINLQQVLTELDLPIQLVKDKLKLFELFKGQDVTINVSDERYSLEDEITKFIFTKPKREYLDDKFITEEDRDQRFVLKSEDLLARFTVTPQISDRIKVSCMVFNVTTLSLLYEGDALTLMTQNVSKNSKVSFMKDINLNKSISDKVSLISFVPFTLDHDGDIDVSIYELKNFLIIKNDMKIFAGEAEVLVTTYCMSEYKPVKAV